jgi:tripartite-type tricarboxylate transporter receptor subunit TctC
MTTGALDRFAVLGVLCLLAATPDAIAQGARDAFPTRPIRMVVPYAPGGSATLVARYIANKVAENLGVSVIVDNRGGGNGKIGAEAVSRSNPDGHTVLFGETGSMAINLWLMDRAGSHTLKDFVAIGQVVTLENILVAHPSAGVKNLKELVAKATAAPVIYGSSGTGTVGHLAMELLRSTLNVKLTHVPYKGGGPAMTDVLGGQIPMLALTVPTAAPHVLSGRLLPVAALSLARTSILPDVPTVGEQGFAPLSVSQWYGFFAPVATPPALVARLHTEFRRAATAPDVAKALTSTGNTVVTGTQEEFAKIVRDDVERWRVVIRDAGVQVN